MLIALVNYKPGSGKSTTAGWLASAIHERPDDPPVALVDADRSRAVADWHEIAPFPFAVHRVARPQAHILIPELVPAGHDVVVDCPQAEDHADIVLSVLQLADAVIVPTSTSSFELPRTVDTYRFLEDARRDLGRPLPTVVSMNRADPKDPKYNQEVRDDLVKAGFTVLATEIPAHRKYHKAWGRPIRARMTHYDRVLTEIRNMKIGVTP
ncbi:ParA family protein [Kitasatospora sp. NPDC058063]|uniref:ParA family protein n=1 Tax=unclassified Kitasatospora TaxID=2633591 RepID=UPI0036DE1176